MVLSFGRPKPNAYGWIIIFLYPFIIANAVRNPRGEKDLKMKKKDGYSRVGVDAIVIALFRSLVYCIFGHCLESTPYSEDIVSWEIRQCHI